MVSQLMNVINVSMLKTRIMNMSLFAYMWMICLFWVVIIILLTTKKMLSSKFKMKDLGVVDAILGIKIFRTSGGLILSQSHYIEKLLDKFDKDESNTARTLVDIKLHLSKNIGKSISQLEYSRIIGV